jgi:AmmeMemoRadiSam system protein A
MIKGIMSFNEREKNFALGLAYKSLEYFIDYNCNIPFDRKTIEKEYGKNSPLLDNKACFVTLHTRSQELRGCMGTLTSEEPLYREIIKNSVIAGLEDFRFKPLTREQLESTHFEITIMGVLEKLTDPSQLKLGQQGLVISRGKQQGLLLPQVALENEWNQTEFLNQTCIKAGIPPDSWKKEGTNIFSFSAQVLS